MEITVTQREISIDIPPEDQPVKNSETRNGQSISKKDNETFLPSVNDISTIGCLMRWFKKLPKFWQTKILGIAHRSARPDVINGIMAKQKRFAPWRSLIIGGVTRKSFLCKFQAEAVSKKANVVRIGHWAKQAIMRPSFKTGKKCKRTHLLLLSESDIGLDKNSRLEDLIDFLEPKNLTAWSAENLFGWRLALCPAEAALHLRSKYRNQPEGESILVAMKPIRIDNGQPIMFVIHREMNDQPSLEVAFIKTQRHLPNNLKILFLLCREKLEKLHAMTT